jgi:uncharacterized protein (TIGR00369 family)
MSDEIRTPKTTRHLEDMKRMVRGEIEPPPIAILLGMRAVEMDLGRSVMELDADRRMANPMGTLHGGVICDLADAAMGTAFATTLEDDETFTSVDLTAKFLKPIWTARIRATARVVKRTRSIGLVECDVQDPGGKLVAKLISTCMVLRGSDAQGR